MDSGYSIENTKPLVSEIKECIKKELVIKHDINFLDFSNSKIKSVINEISLDDVCNKIVMDIVPKHMDCVNKSSKKNKDKRIYISGKISGLDFVDAFNKFEKAEKKLSILGYEIVNPMKLPHIHDKSWESYMSEDLKEMMDCKYIYMLPDWNSSRGAIIEHDLAMQLGMVIYYEKGQSIEINMRKTIKVSKYEKPRKQSTKRAGAKKVATKTTKKARPAKKVKAKRG